MEINIQRERKGSGLPFEDYTPKPPPIKFKSKQEPLLRHGWRKEGGRYRMKMEEIGWEEKRREEDEGDGEDERELEFWREHNTYN